MKKSLFKLAAIGLLVGGTLMTSVANAQSTGIWAISLNGSRSGSPGPSSLYIVDPGTGAGTLVGTDLGYAVNAIAIDPTTGLMYASTTTWNAGGGGFNGLLLVNPAAGTATEVGPFDGIESFNSVLALTFDSSGQLWGWHDPGADDPVQINKATGEATTVGDAGVSTGGHVMAFDAADDLYMIQSSSVYIIDQATGAANFQFSLSEDPGAGGAAFHPGSGLLWASESNGQTQDARIEITDVAGDTRSFLDTDIEYLNAVTIGGAVVAAGAPTPPVEEVPVMAAWQLFGLIGLVAGGALAAIRRRLPR